MGSTVCLILIFTFFLSESGLTLFYLFASNSVKTLPPGGDERKHKAQLSVSQSVIVIIVILMI